MKKTFESMEKDETSKAIRQNQQLFNIMAQKTRGNPFQTVKNMADEEGCSGAGAWVKLLRAYKGKNASRSQRLTERVHDIKRVTSYSEVLPRMEKWEAALKEHVKDTGREVADITMANCLRRLVPTDLYADLQKMSHIVLYSDVKRYIIDQVGLRICHNSRRQKLEHQGPVPMDTSLAETHYNEESGAPQDNEDPELNAFKGKGKGFKGQCFHCGQYGHRLSECRKKDADSKGKTKGFSKGKNPPQQQQQYGKGKGWYWSEPWSEPWKGRSGVHAVEEYGWSQGTGDNTVLFELDALPVGAHEQTEYLQHLPASTSNIVEAVAKEATKKNEEYQRRRMRAPGTKGGAGIRFETQKRFNILGVESEVEESLLTPKAKNELATIEEQNENKTVMYVRTLNKTRSSRWARTHLLGSKGTKKEKNTELQFLENGVEEEMVNGLEEGWMRFASIMDSGAAESVAPPSTCPHFPLMEFPGSRAGQEHRTAGGERLKNKGQRSGRGHQAAELNIKDVRCRKRCHVHGTWRHHKELVDRHDDEVRSRIGCSRSEHLGEAGNTR